jgi:LPS-assembly protein
MRIFILSTLLLLTVPGIAGAVEEPHVDASCPAVSDDEQLNQADGKMAFKANNVQRLGTILELEGDVQILREGRQYLRASRAMIDQEKDILHAEDISYTRCSPDNRVWRFSAKHIKINHQKNRGILRHGVLYFYKLPVMYLPIWWFVPDKDRRATQFLDPEFSDDSEEGFVWEQKYFINLAPHYDLTLGMHFIEERGAVLHADFNYHQPDHVWRVYASDLEGDRLEERAARRGDLERGEALGHRGLYHLGHYSGYRSGLSLDIDYTKLSDPYYGDDFNLADIHGVGDSYVAQRLALNWQDPEWHIALRGSSDQAINEGLALYRIEPNILVDYVRRRPDFQPEYAMKFRYAKFNHPQDGFDEGERSWGQLSIAYPMSWSGFSVRPELSWRGLRQIRTDLPNHRADELSASVDMRLRFERNTMNNDRGNYTHTLEARFFYLHHSLDRQADHANYDTRPLEFSAEQLFRSTRLSGYDYLDDTEHLAIGISGSIDSHKTGGTILRGSIGQIFYARDRLIGPDGEVRQGNYSPLVTSIELLPDNKFSMHSEVIWNIRTDNVDGSLLGLHYRSERYDNSISMEYRFDRRTSLFNERVSQVRMEWGQQYSARWRSEIGWARDLQNHWHIAIDAHLEYRGCCFTVAFSWSREQDEGRQNEYSYGISFGL